MSRKPAAAQNNRSRLTALETGASSGIGKSIAKRLIADGYLVYVAARSTDKMADLAQLGAVPLTMDISKEAGILAAVATITERSGGVDVLVNNAGFGPYGPVEDIALDEARYQFEVNVFGPARLTQLLLPAMRARGKGTIVNITSMGARSIGFWGAGIMPPNMRRRAGPTVCGWRSIPLASVPS